jgi:endogenous inhibitor of DNA gyrase (YacG/DUF329 family)
MNIPFLRKILKQIISQTPCPECGSSLEKASLCPLKKENQKSVFVATCPLCQTEVNFNVASQQIPKELFLKSSLSEISPSLPPLSPEKVEAIGKSLNQFRGADVRELFYK